MNIVWSDDPSILVSGDGADAMFTFGQYPPPNRPLLPPPAAKPGEGIIIRCSRRLALWLGADTLTKYRKANAARSPNRFMKVIPTDDSEELSWRRMV